ncbi:DUF1254 domain-containing protein [Rhodococcus erythropolis]|uniref:DUF1254 domain-containing protein n=1 Tax=Rhodococcus erythropolis TaxID=1833 RepID=UPI0029499DBA|nr:DUF1254 domain-containing protein [Rhodococcus erythropolis]MDV6277442.1 DUF1254 domain-containing protein [Rhodococcus erythropolis]
MSIDRKVLDSISAPDRLKTRLGTMEFTDGAPSKETVENLYDNLDFLHGVNVYINAFQGASTWALRKGLLDVGVEDNSILIFSELMDSQSLFLTANADTVYYIAFIDLGNGPMVVETPPMALGIFDDMWFHWIIDFGLPGPDRGEGGKFLLVPPDYDGPLPDSGFHVGHSGTNRALMLGRSFLQENDPKPTVAVIKDRLKVYPYTPGGYGTSVATLLEGKVPPGTSAEIPETRFVEGSGKAFNTIPPSDFGFYELLNAMVQDEHATATDAETQGQLAAIGIVKGQPFTPDERMRTILDEAAAVGHASARAVLFEARESEGVRYYPDSAWTNMLFPGGYTFETPPPMVTEHGIEPFPPGGAKKLNVRTLFFYGYTGISPAMCMRLTGIGSQYLVAFTGTDNAYFDGAKSYKMTLPPDIPAARFWSLTLYDNQTRSMLQTPQRFPRAGSQSYPSPSAVADSDGMTTVYFGPEQPDGVGDGNWIQSDPDKGFFVILRLYSPLASYFDKGWRPSEIEPT